MRDRTGRLVRWCSRHWVVLSVVGGALSFVALAYVVLKLAPQWFADTEGLAPKDRITARQGVRTAALALLAGGLAVIGSFYTARTFALNRAGHLTDRFTKAIEQLGHLTVDVRLRGIYALERVARDSKDDHPQVVEVLTAYIREHGVPVATEQERTIRPRRARLAGRAERAIPRDIARSGCLETPWMLGAAVGANVLTDAFPATSDLRRSTLIGAPPIAAGCIGGR